MKFITAGIFFALSQVSFSAIDDVDSVEESYVQSPSEYQNNKNDQSAKLSTIPLRPRMSYSNWIKWAGPLVEKTYVVKKGDSLWIISKRLFGNPYLWPKVWELNQNIGNAHIINAGTELRFVPTAPVDDTLDVPGLSPQVTAKGEVMYEAKKWLKKDLIKSTLNSMYVNDIAPFSYYLLDGKPKKTEEMPKIADRLRKFYFPGDTFNLDLKKGSYLVVGLDSNSDLDSTYTRVTVKGIVRVYGPVVEGKFNSELVYARREISEGDAVISDKLNMVVNNVYEAGPDELKSVNEKIAKIDSDYNRYASQFMTVGVSFENDWAGPKPGAFFNMKLGDRKVATVVLVNRKKSAGTAWVYESKLELDGEKVIPNGF